MYCKKIISISRPRFWIYELGTFLVGVLIASTALENTLSLEVIVFALYFLFPANLFIYGINDIFDYETDKLNPKKQEYEELVTPATHKKLFGIIALTNIPFIIFSFFISSSAFVWLLIFLFFAGFYSAPPIRAKAKPFLDSFFSASHYIATGIFGFLLIGGENIQWLIVIAGLAWAIAMHAYSAVPDIEADAQAGLHTIATFLGTKITLLVCLCLYIFAGVVGTLFLGPVIAVLTLAYAAMMTLSYFKIEKIFTLYTFFPTLNTLSGGIIFLLILLERL